MKKAESTYQQIYETVAQIPHGRVATYGQIARLIDNCTARMVGYALAATPDEIEIPWHRIINSQGKISLRIYEDLQKKLLESEGVEFDKTGKISLRKYGW